MFKRLIPSLACAVLLGPVAAFAEAGSNAGHAGHGAKAATATAEPTEATVKKIDPVAGKLTLQHGPLKNLGMPAMTMSFKAGDPAVLSQLKVGDKIRFVAEMSGKDYLATRIEKAK